MGKISILTKNQRSILDLISRNRYLAKQFYFTGGTALTEFYLKHRYSDDLDFFSHQKIDQEIIAGLIGEWSENLKFKFVSRFVEVVFRFELAFPDKEIIKLDFGFFPHKLIEKGEKIGQVSVDSLRDIATNKMTTVNQRTEVKDFVDLYFILKDKYTIWDLIYSAEVKFPDMIFDRYLLSQDLLKVDSFEYLPRMIKPLTLTQLQKFFRKLAVELAKTKVK